MATNTMATSVSAANFRKEVPGYSSSVKEKQLDTLFLQQSCKYANIYSIIVPSPAWPPNTYSPVTEYFAAMPRQVLEKNTLKAENGFLGKVRNVRFKRLKVRVSL